MPLQVVEGLQLLWDPVVLVMIPVGLTMGLLFGMIPGLSGGVANSLVLSLVLFMDPIAALALMTAIYAADQYGGSITAVLLNIPGTGGATATAVEGYQLTKRGLGGEALAIGRASAFVGGIFGALVLLLLSPLLGRWAVQFGPAEFFALAVMGLTVVANFAGRSPLKAIVSVVFGLLCASIGQDPIVAFPRFAFGSANLVGGLNLVWFIVGLFAIPQALSIATGREGFEPYKGRVSVPWAGAFKRLWSYRKYVAAGSLTGTIVGIMPGAGGTIAAWLAYGQARRLSPNPEQFGKGAVEGLVAPEAATDSVSGGTLVPTMTLGIPGSGGAAIILGGMVLAGMRPGPRLFAEQAPQAFAVMLAYLMANVLFLVVVVVFMRYAVQILRIPTGLWPPLIMVFAFFGAYVIERRLFGAWAVLVIGVIGYAMLVRSFPLAPALLGFILGPILEGNYIRITRIAGTNPLDILAYVAVRPIAVGIVTLAVVAIVFEARRKRRGPRPSVPAKEG